MYVIVYTNDATGPAYHIHALDLGSLTDKVSPQLVIASHTLIDGTTYRFNATYQRQRPGLLLANGNVYAGFGSFCDLGASLSRGWLLGWEAGSLTPLTANKIFDTQVTPPTTFFSLPSGCRAMGWTLMTSATFCSLPAIPIPRVPPTTASLTSKRVW